MAIWTMTKTSHKPPPNGEPGAASPASPMSIPIARSMIIHARHAINADKLMDNVCAAIVAEDVVETLTTLEIGVDSEDAVPERAIMDACGGLDYVRAATQWYRDMMIKPTADAKSAPSNAAQPAPRMSIPAAL